MKRKKLRKVAVLNDDSNVEFIAYFHQFYKDTNYNGQSRPCAILELEDGTLYLSSLNKIKFIS